MIQDLHCHSYYSFCGKDSPETIVKAAIEGGIELLGITDHNYGIGFLRKDAFKAPADSVKQSYEPRIFERYCDHIGLIREKYADRIKLLCGIEIATQTSYPKMALPEDADISFFDYCLIEHLDDCSSMTEGDLFSFAKRCGCKWVGVAHTDMFKFIRARGDDPLEYFTKMAESNIFWEMNVSYDSIHKYIEHQYMLDFFSDKAQQDIVRRSGVKLSVGFDGHRIEDYLPQRVKEYCKKIKDLDIPLVFQDL
ncbi:MAG: PHP domain-containing protein [Ruminococcaceae bacterium]|nr:PHP domain-containing protein [Oscillospiraceae bacterium]